MDALNPDNLQAFAKFLLDAVQTRNYGLLMAAALSGVVYLLRKYAAAKWPFLQTQAGGGLLLLGTSLAGALLTTFAAGATVTAPLLLAALSTAFWAAGGWTLASHLLMPLAQKFLPGIFKGDAPAIEAAASAAGAAAADATTPQTAADIVNGAK